MKWIQSFFIPLSIFVLTLSYYFFIEGWGCKLYQRFDFDSQAFLFWQYAALKNDIPYKDIFYPYGILYFLKDQSLLFQLLFYSIPSVLMSISFMTFQKIFKNIFFALLFTVFLFIFTILFTGTEIMARYGVVVIFLLLFASIFSQKKTPSKKVLVGLGVSCGISFSLLTDQGIYACMLFVFFSLLSPLFNTKKLPKMSVYRNVFKTIIIFLIASLGGFLPYFLYLVYQKTFFAFIFSVIENRDILLYAKTPFTPFAASPENIFTFVILFSTTGYLLTKRLIFKTEFSYVSFLQLYFVLLLILLEQKSMIRSISEQLTFISLYVYLFLFAHIRKSKTSGVYVLIVVVVGASLLLFFEPFKRRYVPQSHFNPNACIEENIHSAVRANPDMQQVVAYLKQHIKSGDSIFSYPGDPLFYILLNRPIPYYPSGYESSPLYAQQRQIQYIQKEMVQFVILNTRTRSIQDEVPNYMRNPVELRYLLTHFSPVKRIAHFIIFERNLSPDIFSNNQGFSNDMIEFLLTPHMGKIPHLESLYKRNLIPTDGYKVLHLQNDSHLPQLSSKNIFLDIKTKRNTDVVVKITTEQGLQTRVNMTGCSSGCILHLERVPLFYTERRITQIQSSDRETEIAYFQSENPNFW